MFIKKYTTSFSETQDIQETFLRKFQLLSRLDPHLRPQFRIINMSLWRCVPYAIDIFTASTPIRRTDPLCLRIGSKLGTGSCVRDRQAALLRIDGNITKKELETSAALRFHGRPDGRGDEAWVDSVHGYALVAGMSEQA